MAVYGRLTKYASELLGPSYVPVVVDPRGGATAGLDINGHAPVDASPVLNAFLASATVQRPVCLILDIGVGMLEPLYVANGYASVLGCGHGTGIFMMPGANCHGVSNQGGWQGNGAYPNQNPYGTAPAQSCVNILLKDFFINGNRGTGAAVATPTMTTVSGSPNITVSSATGIAMGQLIQGTGIPANTFVGSISGTTIGMVSSSGSAQNATASGSGIASSFFASNWTTGSPRGIMTPTGGFNQFTWGSGVNLVSCQDVTIDNVYFYNIPSFCCGISNISNYTIVNCYFDGTTVLAINNDGIHIYGQATHGVIADCAFDHLYDDNIAANAPEGYGGTIQYLAISNCVFDHALTFFRCYSKSNTNAAQCFVYDVTISNLTGSLSSTSSVYARAISLELDASHLPSSVAANAIDRISISNVNAVSVANATNYFLGFGDMIGSVTLTGCRYTMYGGGFFAYNAGGLAGLRMASLSMKNCILYRNVALGTPNGGFSSPTACTIDVLDCDLQCEDTDGSSWTTLQYLIDPTNITVSRFILSHLDPTHWAALINGSTWTNLPSISGRGLLESGFQVPDAQIADNTVFVSNAVNSTTATVASGSNQITVAAATGISRGDTLTVGTGLVVGSTVIGINGTTLTLSEAATASGSGVSVTFSRAGSACLKNSAGTVVTLG